MRRRKASLVIVIASTRPDHAHSRVDVSSACSTGAACRFQSWADQAGWEGGCATLKRGRRSLSVADPRRSLSLDGRSISGQERGRIGTGMRKPDVAAMRPRGVITTMTTRTPADAAGPRGSEAGGEGEGSDRSILFVPIRSILSLPIRSILPLPIEGSDRSILSVPIRSILPLPIRSILPLPIGGSDRSILPLPIERVPNGRRRCMPHRRWAGCTY